MTEKKFSRRAYSLTFCEDRNGQWKGRLDREGLERITSGPHPDKYRLFMDMLRKLQAAETQVILNNPTFDGQVAFEPTARAYEDAAKGLTETMMKALEQAVEEVGKEHVADIQRQPLPLDEGLQMILVGHKGEHLVRVTATYDPDARGYDFTIQRLEQPHFTIQRLEQPHGQRRSKARKKRNHR